MNKIRNKLKITALHALTMVCIAGCSKSTFLDEKPRRSILTPSTLAHYQALLDRDSHMNGLDGQGLTPQLGESGSDNIYILDANYNTNLRTQMQNYYTWQSEPYDGVPVIDWEYPFRAITLANIVREGVESTNGGGAEYKYVAAQSLFHRAHLYHQVAQIFAPPYQSSTAAATDGLPLRLSADINEKLTMGSLEEVYELIVGDLQSAIPDLKTREPYLHRPTKQAAYALSSRVYLTMGDYERALVYADSCLQIQGTLLDYNAVNVDANYPFGGGYNSSVVPEILFMSAMLSSQSQNYPITFNNGLIDTNLYKLYDSHDLRKKTFFQPFQSGHRFKGTYCLMPAQNLYFSGLAVDEVYLIRAECRVRSGDIRGALDDINALLWHRWDRNYPYEPYVGLNQEQTLKLVLQERRKELVYRGLRWSDIRRLNLESPNISIERLVNGQRYYLPANDSRWTWPIPLEVMVDR